MSARDSRAASEVDLDPRQFEVLQSVTHEHSETGEPVGSLTVSKRLRPAVSPATVRGAPSPYFFRRGRHHAHGTRSVPTGRAGILSPLDCNRGQADGGGLAQ